MHALPQGWYGIFPSGSRIDYNLSDESRSNREAVPREARMDAGGARSQGGHPQGVPRAHRAGDEDSIARDARPAGARAEDQAGTAPRLSGVGDAIAKYEQPD